MILKMLMMMMMMVMMMVVVDVDSIGEDVGHDVKDIHVFVV